MEPLLWDTSIQGTPPFKRHKIWCWKNAHIIFVSVTSIEGTSLFRGKRGCEIAVVTPLSPLVICVSLPGKHISLVICVPLPGKHIPSDMCSPTWKTHIPSNMCSPTWETHIPSDMCSLTWETHIPNDMCSPT